MITILRAIEISLIVTAIYSSMREGMVFEKVRIQVEKILEKVGQSNWFGKPLYGCLTCMGGIYTLLLYPLLYGYDVKMFKTVLIVIGINAIVDKIIHFEV